MSSSPRIRIAAYNVHKCRGLDRRVQPARVAEVIQEIDADIVAIQEVLNVQGAKPEFDQNPARDTRAPSVLNGPS